MHGRRMIPPLATPLPPLVPGSRRAAGAALALLVAVVLPGVASAQDVGARSGEGSPASDPLCWRGRPLPACSAFLVVEAQVQIPVVSTATTVQLTGLPERTDTFRQAQLDWNLGLMSNVAPRWAVGGVVTLGTGSSSPLTGLRARGRYWLDERLSLELETGAVRSDLEGARTLDPAWGFSTGARLNAGDRGSLFLRWDALDSTERAGDARTGGRVQHALFAGVGAGSSWAVGVTGAGFLLLVLLLSQADFQ